MGDEGGLLRGGGRDLDSLRDRLRAVRGQVDLARNEPSTPLQLRLPALLTAMLPVCLACALIRLAAMHDGVAFGLTLAIGSAVSWGALILCVRSSPRKAELTTIFVAEVISMALVVLPFSLYFLGR